MDRPKPGQPRFFTSSLLENLTKTAPWVIPTLWIPIFLACIGHALLGRGLGLAECLPLVCTGVLLWMLTEYCEYWASGLGLRF